MPKNRLKKRSPVSRAGAIEVAVALADRAGIEALTMRSLAKELGVEAMSLYHHFPNKSFILDGMVDVVFAQIEVPEPGRTDWKTAMRRRAHSARAALNRHPWAIGLMESRAAPGEATLRHHDAVLGCLRAGGFSLALTGHAYSLIDSYLYGFALQEQSLPFDTHSSADTEAVAAEIFAKLPQGAYPHLAEFTLRHVLKPGYSYAKEFEVGLELLLDGLQRALEREAGSSRAT